MASNEAEFSAEVRKDLKKVYPDIHQYLIQDAYKSGKKPYDAYFLGIDEFVALEFKFIKKGVKSLKTDLVTQHQMDYLDEVRLSDQRALVVIGFQETKTAWIIPIIGWFNMLKKYRNKKSVKVNELLGLFRNNCFCIGFKIMNRIKDKQLNCTRWEVEKLYNYGL